VEVLLVEDSAGDVLLTQQLLTEAAVPVKLTIARDGEQALTILGNPEFRPAMIILDLNLPGLSGFDVLERNPRKEIPVVIFSGSANPTDADRSLSLGAREYVVKPLGMADYRNAVVGMVRNWAMSEEESNAAARSDLKKRKRISIVFAGSSSGTTYEVVSGIYTEYQERQAYAGGRQDFRSRCGGRRSSGLGAGCEWSVDGWYRAGRRCRRQRWTGVLATPPPSSSKAKNDTPEHLTEAVLRRSGCLSNIPLRASKASMFMGVSDMRGLLALLHKPNV
jgi:CheY-like chemotaxis protein